MSDAVISSLSLDVLRAQIQQAGYRVETVTDPVANITFLRSATNGLTFDIRGGNRAGASGEQFSDLAFVAPLQVQGELPLDLVNRWNVTRRFGRLQLSPPFLVLSLDVTVAGGVSITHVRAQLEIWDQLVQQLIVYLRDELPKLAPTQTTRATIAPSAAPASNTAPAQDESTPATDTPVH
jgi:Putative bacterial sensory transduction regulator